MKKTMKKMLALGTALVLAMSMMTGCGQKSEIEANGQPKLFTYDGTDVYLNEAWLYATMQKIAYEQQYSSQYSPEELWVQQVDEKTDEDGNTVPVTLEDMVKEETIERIKMNKVMCNRAEELEVKLEDDDVSEIDGYVDAAMENLQGTDMEKFGVTKDTVRSIYEQEMLAQKVYDKVSNGDINLTYNLLFETFEAQDSGERKEFSAKQKAKQKAKAEKALKKLQDGADIVELAEKMKADKSSYVAISEATKANYAQEYVKAAEALEAAGKDGGISPITESDFGYHILMYVTPDNDKYESDEAKNVISSEQQNLFGAKYDEWSKELEEKWDADKDVNQEEWAKVSFIQNTSGTDTENTDEIEKSDAIQDSIESQKTTE